MTEFQWPWEYNFPPFFTLQPHAETRKQQIRVWSDLFLKYLKHHNKFTLNINDNELPLFRNESISRRLYPSFITIILEDLQNSGHAVPLDKKCIEWQVYWYTLDEYANMIYDWIQETGQLNTVCTFYELAQGNSSTSTGFHGIDEAVLMKALRILETKSKCEIIDMDGSYGVKFF